MSKTISVLFFASANVFISQAAYFNLKQQKEIAGISGNIVKEMINDRDVRRSKLKFGQYLNSEGEIESCSQICTEPESHDCQYLCSGRLSSYDARDLIQHVKYNLKNKV